MTAPNHFSLWHSCWRQVLLALSVVGNFAFWLSKPPEQQLQDFYDFADQRTFLSIPNFSDVTTNLAFLFVGIAGLRFCLKNRWEGMRPAWIALFVGLALVSVGSGYFHWNPSDDTLVWDRLPMTIGFMGLFVVVLGEYVSIRLANVLFLPALLLGVASVLYWQRTDDLRFYRWVVYLPQISIPVIMVLFRSGYSHRGYFVITLGCYLLAKVTEDCDQAIFIFTQHLISGHSLKHLLAALGCFALVVMLKRRRLLAT